MPVHALIDVEPIDLHVACLQHAARQQGVCKSAMNILDSNLGPLAALAGIWEGDKGHDDAPADDRGAEVNLFRERIVFEPTGLVQNHEQKLYGLRYATTAWRIGETAAFHEERGYWMWDAASSTVMRCFVVPRGITVIAGGRVEPAARAFELSATLGSNTFGILSAPFLDREFRTVRYQLKVTIHDTDSFSYDEDTQMQMPGRQALFHHEDRNTLRRVG
jgi:hypothetical protein